MTPASITTDLQIKKLKAPIKRQEIKINNRQGLVLRLSPTGGKSFVTKITCSETKKRRTITLGSPDAGMTISEAANIKAEYKTLGVAAKEAKDRAALKAEKAEAAEQVNINDVLGDYYADHLAGLKAPEAVRDIFNRFIIPLLGDTPLADVQTVALADAIRTTKTTNGHGSATKMFSYLTSFFRWCVAMGRLKIDPTAPLDRKTFKFESSERDRYLTREEVPLLLSAIDNAPRMQHRTKIGLRLLMLTGMRSGELIQAEWKHIDFTNKTWLLPAANTKTNAELVIPLAPQAITLLVRLKEDTKESGMVMGELSPKALIKALTRLQTPNKNGERLLVLDEKLNVHDLRRSFTTFLTGLKVPYEVREKMVNHKPAGVSKIYNRWDYRDERKAAGILLADALDNPLELLPAIEGDGNG
jgi:integrase